MNSINQIVTSSFEVPNSHQERDLADVRQESPSRRDVTTSPSFWIGKRIFDIVVSIALLLPLAVVGLLLLIFNPLVNPGPLLFVQVRMGKSRRAFALIKFRTMLPQRARRSADCPLEHDRITPLGRFLRKSRIDELPQILNVLRGDMSLIGPRPDVFSHAKDYYRKLPDYRERFAVRPGISGLAQVEHGYAEGIESTREKARLDAVYVRSACVRLEAYIFLQTLKTVFAALGK